MADSLLNKTRQINRLLQRSENIDYDGISGVLSNVLEANVYITDKKGNFCGYALVGDFECALMLDHVISQKAFPTAYVNLLLKKDETKANRRSTSGKCVYDDSVSCMYTNKNTTIVPIYGVGDRFGTLIIAKFNGEFDDDDILLAEYGATVIGMEMLRDYSQKKEIEVRNKAVVQTALDTLSFSEIEAAASILEELKGTQGELVASSIADKIQITRSVIVNALRKLQSAGVIKAQSLGMKGTHIEVLNEYLVEEIKKLKPKNMGSSPESQQQNLPEEKKNKS